MNGAVHVGVCGAYPVGLDHPNSLAPDSSYGDAIRYVDSLRFESVNDVSNY